MKRDREPGSRERGATSPVELARVPSATCLLRYVCGSTTWRGITIANCVGVATVVALSSLAVAADLYVGAIEKNDVRGAAGAAPAYDGVEPNSLLSQLLLAAVGCPCPE
jgi:hypothetical protein